MLDYITYPFRAAYQYVCKGWSNFCDYLAQKVESVATQIFTQHYENKLQSGLNELEEKFSKQIDSAIKAKMENIQQQLTKLNQGLKDFSQELDRFPNAIGEELASKLPNISIHPLEEFSALKELKEQTNKFRQAIPTNLF